MKPVNCPYEVEVSRAARTGEWQDSLQTHVAGCPACADVVRAARWMQALASGDETDAGYRDASLVWWRAQLVERQAKAERARTALEWAEIASTVAVVGGLGGWAAWNRQVFGAAADWLGTILSPQIATHSAVNSLPVSFWAVIAVTSLVVLFVAYPILTTED